MTGFWLGSVITLIAAEAEVVSVNDTKNIEVIAILMFVEILFVLIVERDNIYLFFFGFVCKYFVFETFVFEAVAVCVFYLIRTNFWVSTFILT